VEQLAGKRSVRDRARQAYRWGSESGFCIIDGQRVPMDRPRVRGRASNREIPLGSYELFQRASLIGETVWHKIMHGLTMRSYKEVVQQFAEAYGFEKSTTSDHFIETSRLKLEPLQKRSYRELCFSVIIIDGTIFKGEHLLVAIGVDPTGRKLVLGLRQGSTENSAVVRDLLGDLMERGIDFYGPAALHRRWQQGDPLGHPKLCRRRRVSAALPGAQDPQCGRILAGSSAACGQVSHAGSVPDE
jgi:putative transposase